MHWPLQHVVSRWLPKCIRYRFKKMAPNKIKNWKCSKCTVTQEDLARTTPGIKDETLNISIKDLENSLIGNKLLENSENDGEKLEMAAKIGAETTGGGKYIFERKKLNSTSTIGKHRGKNGRNGTR